MENKKNEQVIYLKDLLFAALHRWRAVLVTALIAAVLLGGIKCISHRRDASGTETDAQYQAALEQYALNAEVLTTKVEILQERLESQQNYLENSMFMSLNPYEFYAATLSLHVDTGYQIIPSQTYQTVDKTAAVLAAYEASFLGENVVQQLADTVNTQPQFIQELVTCTATPSSGAIIVTVSCVTNDNAKAVLEVLAAQVDALHESISGSVVEHTVSILDQSVTRKVDLTLATKQSEVTDRLNTLQKSLTEAEQQLNALVAPVSGASDNSSLGKTVVIFAVLGGILGAFLCVCVIWVMHITSNKVYSARTLRDRTGVKVLGCLNSSSQKCAIDRWLLKKEGRCINDISVQAALLATNIRNRCNDSSHVLVTGSHAAEARKTLVQALQAAMPGVKVTNAESLFSSADALAALAACDKVLLTEQCGISQYSKVSEEIEVIRDHNKELIGCVVLNG